MSPSREFVAALIASGQQAWTTWWESAAAQLRLLDLSGHVFEWEVDLGAFAPDPLEPDGGVARRLGLRRKEQDNHRHEKRRAP